MGVGFGGREEKRREEEGDGFLIDGPDKLATYFSQANLKSTFSFLLFLFLLGESLILIFYVSLIT